MQQFFYDLKYIVEAVNLCAFVKNELGDQFCEKLFNLIASSLSSSSHVIQTGTKQAYATFASYDQWNRVRSITGDEKVTQHTNRNQEPYC